MNRICQQIETLLSDDSSFFVFPSEIAAREWAVYLLLKSGKAALDPGRFISWDKFKENTFQLYQNEKPVNRELRSLFAAHLLEKNRQDRSLDFLVPAEYSGYGQRFRRTVELILMSINSRERLQAGEMDPAWGKKLGDVYSQYSVFLKEQGLYEPAGVSPRLETKGKKYLILFPEIITDFGEYKSMLAAAGGIEFFHVPDGSEIMPLNEFAAESREISWIADQFEKILNENPRAELALSCAGSDEMRTALLAAFRLRDIPFTERMGKKLGDCPGTAVFRHIRQLMSAEPGLSVLSAAVFDNALVWKDSDSIKKMIAFLAGRNFVKNSGQGKTDMLEKILFSSGNRQYTDWYKKFRSALARITKADSFDAIAGAVSDFVYGFLDFGKLDENVRREYQLAEKKLRGMSLYVDQISALELPGLYDIFMDHLDNSIYVPRQERSGVQIYPYRVAAGIPADLHIVCGCARSASQVKLRPFPFLSENQRSRLKIEDSDFSEDFLKTYLCAGGLCTYSRQSADGSELPPGLFIRSRKIEKKSEVVLPEEAEKDFWKGRPAGIRKFSELYQKSLAENMGQLAGFDGRSRKKAEVTGPLFESLLKEWSSGTALKFSSTSIHAWYACPFSFLFKRMLYLEETRYDAEFTDHAVLGTVLHETAEQFFTKIGSMKDAAEMTEEQLHQELDAAFEQAAARQRTPYFPPAWNADLLKLRGDAHAWLNNERRQFPAASALELEGKYEYLDESCDVIYEGKIDRIGSDNGDEFIIDYKKGIPDSMARIAVPDMNAGSKQLPFYILLLRKNGRNPAAAWYYSFKQGKYIQIFVSKALSGEQMDELTAWLESKVKEAAEAVRKGVFSACEEGCEYCSFRGLCRIKFVLP